MDFAETLRSVQASPRHVEPKSNGLTQLSFMFGIGAIIGTLTVPIVGVLTAGVGGLLGLVGLAAVCSSGGKQTGIKLASYGIGLSAISGLIFFSMMAPFFN